MTIAPTREMCSSFARAYWHWFFLIQPKPLPEQIIGKDPEAFWKLKCFNQTSGDNPFTKEALAEYLEAFKNPEDQKKLVMPIFFSGIQGKFRAL